MAPLDQLASEVLSTPRAQLGATYRLQMHAGFTLRDARAVLDYLHALGITHLYLSSLVAAKPGSTHGYDVIDHGRLNPELGTIDDLVALASAARERGMGLLLDTVPNHMSVGGPNAWWQDVLEHGRSGRYADHFDIAWDDHPREPLRGKVLLPILGERYGAALAGGQVRVAFAQGAFQLQVNDAVLPLDPRSYAAFLAPLVEAMPADDNPVNNEFRSILTSIRNLPPHDDTARAAERWDETVAIKRRLAAVAEHNPDVSEAIVARVAEVSASAEELDHLIEAQAYRPCYWRVASDEINYRRFFDVNDLAALATERENVFADVHRLTFQWLADGLADGLRIDHVDGLFDPRQYLERLQVGYRMARAEKLLAEHPESYPGLTWTEARPQLVERFTEAPERSLTVVVEKILGPRERLPDDWATDGTTGYEFANVVGGLFVDPAGERPLTAAYQRFTERIQPFHELVYQCKFLVLQSSLTSELHVLAGHLDRLAQANRWNRDFTLNGLRHALREVIACFPVYRSYVTNSVSPADRDMVQRAIRAARRRNPSMGDEVFGFIRDTLLLRHPTPNDPVAQERFVGKFQQLTAPVMAKGFEDTALYRDARLIALNEVGGHPARFGLAPAEVHAFLQTREPGGLSPLSTHDTKRSEDVRARIAVVAELAEEFGKHVERWAALNEPLRIELDGGVIAPDRNEEWLLYQSLLGAWPVDGLNPTFVDRMCQYMTKVLREAKVNSSWLNPDAAYDEAVAQFIRHILDRDLSAEFLDHFATFEERVRQVGQINSLAQTLIRCTAPGVPDTYQGTEFWDDSLVDPDNRRPVDFAARADALRELDGGHFSDPRRTKLLVMSRALRLRRSRPALFRDGSYVPLPILGPLAEHAFAFARMQASDAVLVVVPRCIAKLRGDDSFAWGETAVELPETLQGREWASALTGVHTTDRDGRLPLRELFALLPVACLSSGTTDGQPTHR